MKFAELLRAYIGDRTVESVVEKCAEHGVRLNRVSVSQMRSGTRLPPTDDDAIRAIATVCERDPEPLLWLAWLERKPHLILSTLVKQALSAFKAQNELLTALLNQQKTATEALQSGSPDTALRVLQGTESQIEVLWDRKRKHSGAFFDMFQAVYGELRDTFDPILASHNVRVEDVDDGPVIRPLLAPVSREQLIDELARDMAVPSSMITGSVHAVAAMFEQMPPEIRKQLLESEGRDLVDQD